MTEFPNTVIKKTSRRITFSCYVFLVFMCHKFLKLLVFLLMFSDFDRVDYLEPTCARTHYKLDYIFRNAINYKLTPHCRLE